jgi:hypothetical protein
LNNFHLKQFNLIGNPSVTELMPYTRHSLWNWVVIRHPVPELLACWIYGFEYSRMLQLRSNRSLCWLRSILQYRKTSATVIHASWEESSSTISWLRVYHPITMEISMRPILWRAWDEPSHELERACRHPEAIKHCPFYKLASQALQLASDH